MEDEDVAHLVQTRVAQLLLFLLGGLVALSAVVILLLPDQRGSTQT